MTFENPPHLYCGIFRHALGKGCSEDDAVYLIGYFKINEGRAAVSQIEDQFQTAFGYEYGTYGERFVLDSCHEVAVGTGYKIGTLPCLPAAANWRADLARELLAYDDAHETIGP